MSWPIWTDRLINRLKWPAAILAMTVTPLLAWGMWLLLVRSITNPLPLVPFFAGGVSFVILWRRWLGRSRLGRFAVTLEHEATHALFALLTGHRIVGFRATAEQGGQVRFTESGNWLIVAAPYFFPTSALLLFLIAYVLPFQGLLPWQSFLLGVALGYHIVSTIRETHKDQTDIQQLGTAFCWSFLPAANLAVIGLLISFAHGGSVGMRIWIHDTLGPASLLLEWARNQLTLLSLGNQ